MEHAEAVERRKAGIAAAQARGKHCGRPQSLRHESEIKRRLADGQAVIAIATALRCHSRVVRRVRDGSGWRDMPRAV